MKNYNEITSHLLERKKSYEENRKKKNRNLIRISSTLCLVIVLTLSIGIMKFDWFKKPLAERPFESDANGPHQQSERNAGEKAYPYEDKIRYLPKEVPVSKYDNGFFAYHQIKNVDTDMVSLYACLYDSSQLRRDCHPVFNKDGSVTFLRKSQGADTDEKKYGEIVSYLGNKSTLMYTLSELPQNINKSISCILFQNGKNPTTTGVGLGVNVYENCRLNIIVSKDFNAVSEESVRNAVNDLKAIKDTDGGSVVEGKDVSIGYVYQTRFSKEKNIDEERFVFYALFPQDDRDYLVQFSSNYTAQNSDRTAYGAQQRSQEECKKAFEEIVQTIINEGA